MTQSRRRIVPILAVLLGLVACLGLAAGCYGNETSPFPPGLEPAGDNVAEYPTPEGDDAYPEKLTLVTGTNDSYAWANAKGYIHAPLADVWAALQDPEVVVVRRKVDKWSVTDDVEPEYEVSFRVSETVYDLITVDFQVTWREGTVERSAPAEAPTSVIAVFQKTWGSTVIESMKGSVLLKRVDDGTTAVETVEHLDALMSAEESVASYQPDLFASLKARAHGQPLPTY